MNLERPHQAGVAFDAVDAGILRRAFEAGVAQVEVTDAGDEVEVVFELVGCAQAGAGDEVKVGAALWDAVGCFDRAEGDVGEDGGVVELEEVVAENAGEAVGPGVGFGLPGTVAEGFEAEGEVVEDVVACQSRPSRDWNRRQCRRRRWRRSGG